MIDYPVLWRKQLSYRVNAVVLYSLTSENNVNFSFPSFSSVDPLPITGLTESLPSFPHPDTLAIRDVSFSETSLDFYCFLLAHWHESWPTGKLMELSQVLDQHWALPAGPGSCPPAIASGSRRAHAPFFTLPFLFPIPSPPLQWFS